MNTSEPDAVKGEKRVNYKRRGKRTVETGLIYIGRNIKRLYQDGHTETGYKINKRFLVRGHWRKQPCGSGRSSFMNIWIKPYIKGKGEYQNKDYKVVGAGT